MRRLTIGLIAAVLGASCAGPTPVEPSGAVRPNATNVTGGNVALWATGDGTYDAGVIVEFSMNALRDENGNAKGEFRHSTILGGEVIDFTGRVTCMAVDSINGRAWIGGVVTHNDSTHPSFSTPIHQVGRDVWFRVLDSGEGSGSVDRSTFLGFEGAAGIITSAEYCVAQIWPDDPPNARTSPLTSGNIQVRP